MDMEISQLRRNYTKDGLHRKDLREDPFEQFRFWFGQAVEAQLLEPDASGEPFMKRLPMDPWDNEYVYELTSDNQPLITSYGEDGEPGNCLSEPVALAADCLAFARGSQAAYPGKKPKKNK